MFGPMGLNQTLNIRAFLCTQDCLYLSATFKSSHHQTLHMELSDLKKKNRKSEGKKGKVGIVLNALVGLRATRSAKDSFSWLRKSEYFCVFVCRRQKPLAEDLLMHRRDAAERQHTRFSHRLGPILLLRAV